MSIVDDLHALRRCFSRRDRWRGFARAVAGLVCCGPLLVAASDLPVVNLGLTSYLDGVLPSGTGLYYQNYLEHYTSARLNDSRGARLALPRQDLALWADINQFTYYFNKAVGPGRLAFDLVIPLVTSVRTEDGLGNHVLNSQTGVGDMLFGPIYQFDPVTLAGGGSLHQSVEFDVLAPTGLYDRRVAINPGSHAWALDPFYAVTWFASRKLSFSGRFHYLYNFVNEDPPLALGAGARTIQAGQAFHMNLDVAYATRGGLGFGINSYYLKQVTNTRINGVGTLGRRERVLGIGPGAFYQVNSDTFLFFNAYWETLAQNRPEGARLLLRVVQHF